MKKFGTILTALLLTVAAAQAQTLNVVTGNVTYQFPAANLGDMTYTGGTSLTIGGKTFAIADITKIYVEDDATAAQNAVENNTVAIAYSGTSAQVTVAGNVAPYVTPTLSGAHVSIQQTNTADIDDDEITYSLSGSSSDGEFYMKGSYKATIDLNGVTLTNATPVYSGAALHIQDGKRINISVKKDTENTLTDCASPSDDLAQKAALYVKGHAEFKGKGTLNVYGKYKHAIKAGEYISMKNCTINVKSSVSDGFNCNEYFLMESGTLALSGIGDDGIQADIDEDADTTTETTDHDGENSGNLYILDGTLTATITATAAKGVKAAGSMTISGGTINVTTSGNGVVETETDSDGTTTTDAKGAAGLKADKDMTITGGTLTLKSTGTGGKCIKADGTLTILGDDTVISATSSGSNYSSGSYSASAKAIKAGTKTATSSGRNATYSYTGGIVITGGTTTATASAHEAIESKSTIDISGGTIYAQSKDDAINSGSTFNITGGTVCGYSTGNDGLDANGNFNISGGIVYAIGTTSPEVGIDANTEGGYKLTITGGTVVAIGGLESGSTLSQTCYQLGSSTSTGGNTGGRGGWGGGGFGPGGNSGSQSWTANTWYGLYSNGTLALAFKTPSSGGSSLVVTTNGTTTLSSGVTVNGATIWNGMGALTEVSGGSSAELSQYSNSSSGGGRGW
ncbi:MAG: carbohydrate-binding domain-containing protein [Bacteroidaceae bacterium]|nr:carbohydrate-binding domain-containing protein [Bacteroidaceae bacterium]